MSTLKESIDPKTYAWFYKVGLLKMWIKDIDVDHGKPVSVIAAFLLKTQVLEFELKQLFTTPDMEIKIACNIGKFETSRIVRFPNYFDEKTLGETIVLFNEFDGVVTSKLKNELKKLNKLRIQFTHKLFDNKSDIERIGIDAQIGLTLVEKLLTDLESIKNQLDKNWIAKP